MGLNKGQASVTDAMFFLIIIAALTVFVYPFTISYGDAALDNFGKQYRKAYADSALKTLLYLSVPRDGKPLNETTEVDLLLTMIKEDYADKVPDSKTLTPETKKMLAKKIFQVMYFVNPNFDYFFYFKSTDNPEDYFFIFFKVTVVQVGKQNIAGKEVSVIKNSKVLTFYCDPTVSNDGKLNTFLEETLFIKVKDVATPAINVMFFPVFKENSITEIDSRKVVASLALWTPPTPIEIPDNFDLDNEKGRLDGIKDFFGDIGCEEYDFSANSQ